jgi:Ca2+-binding RTX toxin-like protein
MPTSPGLSEVITVTLRNRSGKLSDQVSKNNALLARLKEKGKIKPFSGGRTIVQELEYQENSTFVRYAGYETLNISPQDIATAAEFSIKQAAIAVTISGLEQLMNSGKEQQIDLLESRIANAERSFQNNMAADVYSDGTASGGKQIGGLQLLVADTPTSGTVGGIDRATYSWWRNVSYDATTDGSAAATAANIQSYMNRVYMQLVRGTDHPDLIIADNNYFRLYWESLQAIQRITSDKEASAGFMSLKYMGSDVIFDGGYGGNAPANHMYFLNTNHIFLRPHKDRNFVALDPEGGRFSVNQDALVKLWAWAGNLTTSNCFLSGLLKD